MVGAYVLAGELAAARGNYGEAFARYEAEMREFVQKGQALANGARFSLTPSSRAHVWFRNQMIRMLPHMPWKGMISAGVEKAANAIELKDYEVHTISRVAA